MIKRVGEWTIWLSERQISVGVGGVCLDGGWVVFIEYPPS